MKLSIVSNYTQLGKMAAQQVVDYVTCAPESCLVFPTGNTPLGMYRELVNAHKSGKVSFKGESLVELDDYFGIPMDDSRNLFAWLGRTFIDHVDISPGRLYRFNTNAADASAEAAIEKQIDKVTVAVIRRLERQLLAVERDADGVNPVSAEGSLFVNHFCSFRVHI